MNKTIYKCVNADRKVFYAETETIALDWIEKNRGYYENLLHNFKIHNNQPKDEK